MPKKGKGKGPQKEKGGTSKPASEKQAQKVKPANHVRCRHILCEKYGRIMEAFGQLQEGKQFSAVAAEFSEDKARDGGNLGWLARGQMVGPFQERAFSQQIGVYTEPFRTVHGYHILLVEERKN